MEVDDNMSIEVRYAKSSYVKELHYVIVENKRDCFFEGERTGAREYLGIYQAGGRQKVVLIEDCGGISLLADFTAGDGLTLHIQGFHETHEKCRRIPPWYFFDKLRKRIERLGIGEYQPSESEAPNADI